MEKVYWTLIIKSKFIHGSPIWLCVCLLRTLEPNFRLEIVTVAAVWQHCCKLLVQLKQYFLQQKPNIPSFLNRNILLEHFVILHKKLQQEKIFKFQICSFSLSRRIGVFKVSIPLVLGVTWLKVEVAKARVIDCQVPCQTDVL